jgi:hypothetical protein
MVEKRDSMITRPEPADADAPEQDAAWSRLLADPRVEAAVASVRRVSGVPPAGGGRPMAPPPRGARGRSAEHRAQAGAAHAPPRADGGEHRAPPVARSAAGGPENQATGEFENQKDPEAGAPQVAKPEPERRIAATAPERRPARNRVGPAPRGQPELGQEPRRQGPAARRLDPRVGKTGLIVGALIAVLLHLFVFMAFGAGEGMQIADRLSAPVEQLLDSVIRSLQAADWSTGAATG